MKKFLIITSIFFSSNVFSQAAPVKINIADSVTIVYESSKKFKTATNQPFYYVDGKLSSSSYVEAIDPENIKDVSVKRNANGVGEIHIILIDPSKIVNLVLLSQEIEKYLGKLDTPTIFMLDQQFLKNDLATYKIKENNILRIEVLSSDDILSLKQSRLKLRVVKIFTKSKHNIEKSKQILIRGKVIDVDNG